MKAIQTSRFLILCIPFSLCFSQRLNGLVILLYLVSVLFQRDLPGRFRGAMREKWIYPFIMLYLIQACSLLWTSDLRHGIGILTTKASLLALPLFMAMDRPFDYQLLKESFLSLTAGCLGGLAYCLVYAGTGYLINGESAIFFYHSLGRPLNQFNALYFSFYVLTALIFLDWVQIKPALKILVSAFLVGGLILLSSRLFILLTLAWLGIKMLTALRIRDLARSFFWWLAAIAVIVTGVWGIGFSNERFAQIGESDFGVLKQDQFSWDTPFNGLTLRLVFARFGMEALQEKGVWLSGVGVGDAKAEMNRLVVSHNLYHGNPLLGDSGYLGYDFHNQFLELSVQSGLPALIAWIWLLVTAGRLRAPAGLRLPFVTFLITLVLFSLIEGALERQRGVVFLVFYLSMFFKCSSHDTQKHATI